MKHLVGERENFEILAARTTRDILERLRTGHVQSEEPEAEPGLSRNQLKDRRAGAPARPDFTVEINQPEMVGPNIFLPAVEGTEALNWGILTEMKDPSVTGSKLFSISVILDGKVDDRTFVSLCYDHFLGRTADECGLQNYFEATRSGQISRRDVMKLILASHEARSLGKRIALMPEPAVWLANYVPDYSPDDPFPVFELRY